MNRVSLSLEPSVYQLIKNKSNKSKYISDLILEAAYEKNRDTIAMRTKEALLKDEDFFREITVRLARGETVSYARNPNKTVQDFSPPESYA
jgi:uncharacterized protein (DUF1778 family)